MLISTLFIRDSHGHLNGSAPRWLLRTFGHCLRVEFAGVQVIKTGLGEGWMDGIELQIVRDTNAIRLAFFVEHGLHCLVLFGATFLLNSSLIKSLSTPFPTPQLPLHPLKLAHFFLRCLLSSNPLLRISPWQRAPCQGLVNIDFLFRLWICSS